MKPGWTTESLGNLCEISIGRTPARAQSRYWREGTLRWLTIADMSQGLDLVETKQRITEAAVAECGGKLVAPGTLVMSFKLSVGKLGFVRVPMYTNEAIAALPVRNCKKLEPRFLYRALQVAHLTDGADRAVKGLTLNSDKLSQIPVAYPIDIGEQRHIADVLDKADAIRRKRKEAIKLCEELLRSAFLEMVGPGAPDYARWHFRTVESLAARTPNSMRTGPFGSDLRHSEFVNDGIAVLGIDNAVKNRFAWDERRFITREKYEGLQRYTVFPGDVIVTIMGTTGRSAVVPDDIPTAITTKHLATITLDRDQAEPEFVSQALFRHPEVLRQIAASNRGAIMSGLNLGLIKALRIPVPPPARQREFTKVTHKIRTLATRMANGDEAEKLFTSLLGRAFAGKLTVAEAPC